MINDILENSEYQLIFNESTIFAKTIKIYVDSKKYFTFIVQATNKRIRLLDQSGIQERIFFYILSSYEL